MKHCALTVSLLVGIYAGTALAQQEAGAPTTSDNGTDPTKLSRSASIGWDRQFLRDGAGTVSTFKLNYSEPFTESRRFALRVQLPLVDPPELPRPGTYQLLGDVPVVFGQTTGRTSGGYRLGDIAVKLTHVPIVTPEYGVVIGGEVVFDTADGSSRGSGQTVFKASGAYAIFLQGGNIFAPAIVQSVNISRAAKGKTNGTVLDFYYVPKLARPGAFMTIDPALIFDHENNKSYASLAVTLGQSIGKHLGGNAQLSIKPTVFTGADRPARWGIEFGYKLIGF